MPDREKVIKGLEQFKADFKPFCGNHADWERFDAGLALLKEQEPVEPKASEWLEDSDPGQEYGTTWACRKCMHSIHEPYIWNPYNSGYKYCFHCGARMEVRLDA